MAAEQQPCVSHSSQWPNILIVSLHGLIIQDQDGAGLQTPRKHCNRKAWFQVTLTTIGVLAFLGIHAEGQRMQQKPEDDDMQNL